MTTGTIMALLFILMLTIAVVPTDTGTYYPDTTTISYRDGNVHCSNPKTNHRPCSRIDQCVIPAYDKQWNATREYELDQFYHEFLPHALDDFMVPVPADADHLSVPEKNTDLRGRPQMLQVDFQKLLVSMRMNVNVSLR
jgi:hypothetical protein